MVHRRIVQHLVPHDHDGISHRAHGLSLVSLFVYFQIFFVATAAVYVIRSHAPQILGTVTFSADQIISLTNAKRAENGLGPLSFNSLLAQAASAKAADMFASNYWAHNSPSGRTPWSFITAAGYRYVFAGENLARDFDDAGAVVNAWMASPSHKSNLLDRNFKEIGVAVSSGNLTGHEGILVVQMFGSSVSEVAQASVSPPPSVAGTNQTPASPSAAPALQASSLPQASPFAAPSPQIESPTVLNPVGPELSATVLSGRKFSIAKGISLAVVSLVFLLFAAEVVVSVKREDLTLRSGILAHLGILALALFAVWYAVSGAIL